MGVFRRVGAGAVIVLLLVSGVMSYAEGQQDIHMLDPASSVMQRLTFQHNREGPLFQWREGEQDTLYDITVRINGGVVDMIQIIPVSIGRASGGYRRAGVLASHAHASYYGPRAINIDDIMRARGTWSGRYVQQDTTISWCIWDMNGTWIEVDSIVQNIDRAPWRKGDVHRIVWSIRPRAFGLPPATP